LLFVHHVVPLAVEERVVGGRDCGVLLEHGVGVGGGGVGGGGAALAGVEFVLARSEVHLAHGGAAFHRIQHEVEKGGAGGFGQRGVNVFGAGDEVAPLAENAFGLVVVREAVGVRRHHLRRAVAVEFGVAVD